MIHIPTVEAAEHRGEHMSDTTKKQWESIAIEILGSIYSSVNTRDMVGTSDETGCMLLFFNAQNHNGKSTLISTTSDPTEIKKILTYAIRHLNLAKIVEPTKVQ